MTWQQPPESLRLEPACVDIWRSPIDLSGETLAVYRSTLAEEELARAARFRIEEKYREYVVTRGLLRAALARCLGQPASAFEFQYSAGNKPWLDMQVAGQAVSLNVSHSHGLALVALSLGRRLGVDVEKIRDDVDYEKLALRYFSANEKVAFSRYRGDRARAFFAIWTRKEAFVKAVGKGIAYGLSEFDVNVEPDEPPRMLRSGWQEKDVENWAMASIPCGKDYMATVAADGGSFRLRLWQ